MEMKLQIVHDTLYTFSQEVCLEPHYFRLQPGITPNNSLQSFDLDVSPKPLSISTQNDCEKNLIQFGWFQGSCNELRIKAKSIVTIEDNNPFDFILFPQSYLDLPFSYSDKLIVTLSPSLTGEVVMDELEEYGQNIMIGSDYKTLNFINNLTHQIHQDFKLVYREEGEPHNANHTFDIKSGSCRDLAWMQIQLLRAMGIATKFVSGYFFIESGSSKYDLHAWLEVYLPGAGWIAFDPSNGSIAGDRYIPLCSCASYKDAMPVTGSFRGEASSTLNTFVSIQVLQKELMGLNP